MKLNSISLTGKSVLLLGVLSAFSLVSCETNLENPAVTDATSQSADAFGQSGKDYVANELLVKFKAGVSEEAKANVLAKIGGKVSEKILTKVMERAGDKEGLLVLHTPLAALEAISKAKGLAEVEYAEPNFIYTHDVTSNDTYFTNNSLWGMKGSYGSNAEAAWSNNHTGSETVYIGIIDEGYMYTHEDLAANAGTNPKEIAGNKVDDDKNGYVDDVYGWDFAGNDNTVFDGTSDDHGTHVAGTIGAVGGNGKGVAGVNWNVKMLSAKFLGTNGGTTANAIKAVDYFTNLKIAGLNIVATNNSWGGGGFSQALKEAIDRAGAQNILFIAAAGNDGLNTETTASYPSGYASENIIAVASITSTGALSSFSNYAATKVDIGAPGSNIYSTLPASSKGKQTTSSYGSYNGTSMATPHVSGAAALYAAYHQGSSAATIKAAILNSAVPTASLSGKCVTGGRLNVSGF